MRYSRFITRAIDYALGFALGLLLVGGGVAGAATLYGAGTLLQNNEVYSRHILNGTILDEDISAATTISLAKFAANAPVGSVLLSGGTAVATTSALSFATSTGTLSITGGIVTSASSTISGGLTVSGNATTTGDHTISGNLTLSGTCTGCSAAGLKENYTIASGSITLGNAVTMATSTETALVSIGGSGEGASNEETVAQGFVVPAGLMQITKIVILVGRNSGGSAGCSADIELQTSSGGQPSGTVVTNGTASWSGTCNNGTTNMTATFATAPSVTPGTTYFIVQKNFTMSSHFMPRAANGSGQAYESSNGGASWSAVSNQYGLSVYGWYPAQGTIRKADAAGGTGGATGFIGFAAASGTAGDTIPVVIAGRADVSTTVFAGSLYYLSNTPGALSTSAGTVSKKACVADSPSTCIITNIW